MSPFQYPTEPHRWRHGPRGYSSYSSYLPWLPDEFNFRCVYCLRREQWDSATSFEIDHLLPVSQTEQQTPYENLLFACSRCNSVKGPLCTASPLHVLLNSSATVDREGVLHATDAGANELIKLLSLNGPAMIRFRRLWIQLIELSKQASPELYRTLMGFPDQLPDLRKLRPPGGNDRPAGIEQSYFAQRERGKLPETY